MKIVTKDDKGIRPAGDKDKCLYCGSKIGEYHKENCVTITKRVKVMYSFCIEIEVPKSWDKEQIEFFRNESRWCADNSIHEIVSYAKEKESCLCPFFECRVLNKGE